MTPTDTEPISEGFAIKHRNLIRMILVKYAASVDVINIMSGGKTGQLQSNGYRKQNKPGANR